jgi:hypothetical protein
MIRPLVTKKGCLKCHGHQGYAVGDIRGGVSVSIPMLHYRELGKKASFDILLSFGLLWGIGLFFISFFILRFQTIVKQRIELQQIAEKHKLLSEFIPICASCKKIRDDKEYWNQIESYIKEHSTAEFSHGICPECEKKLYPDID